ncbi:tRNA modification GTPase [Mariniblastus fucicola]|uniref:tRNA modification GTPase MnmE n=1 Tax=Mariniblastus fucicola TaxID=980251 RepID=A0A5B9PJK3_9BACT|nr:GTPase [Mariniblastus fucicola]QEG22693.1 tRNA modification GTPase MnmE [Mariniblastus fucicola]
MGVSQSHEDTIVAVASPHGPGIRGIVRLSGPATVQCVSQVFRSDSGCDIASTRQTDSIPGSLSVSGVNIPGNLLLWPTERSFTKQPSAEFHTFGSPPVLELAVNELCRYGARPAEPGEFTMRAFLSGRLDLTQAEAVLAVIDAKNRKQLDVAIDQLAGGMGSRLDATRTELIAALAELEAGLDFVEEDIEFISNEAMIAKLTSALGSIEALLLQLTSRDSRNDRFRVGLFGLPNAGKSSLFNTLASKELAIVSDIQGTTTDRVSAVCEIDGQRLELVDTAGLEQIEDASSIAAASQQHRADEIRQCDLALVCISAADSAADVESQLHQLQSFPLDSTIVVLTKIDQVDADEVAAKVQQTQRLVPAVEIIASSSETARGAEQLQQRIAQAASDSQSAESAVVGSTMLRTGQSLEEAQSAIESALSAAQSGIGEEVVASEVRSALDCIGLVVGTIYTDDILDVVFGKFCIGK